MARLRHRTRIAMRDRRRWSVVRTRLAGRSSYFTDLNTSSKGAAMTTMKEASTEFLSHRRVAVTGVSRTPGSHGSNAVYKRLRERGYEVFAVNPNADVVEGD